MPLDNSHLYRPGQVNGETINTSGFALLKQPLVNHETGNIGSFPDVEAMIPHYEGGPMKPYWLTPVRDSLASRGLLQPGPNNSSATEEDSGALWAARSAKMFVFAWKDRMEAMRKTEQLSGYEFWMLQDYWQASQGILDAYYKPKFDTASMVALTHLNDGIQLLVAQVGLGCFVTLSHCRIVAPAGLTPHTAAAAGR